jgi:F-type H+-transporting ATPase subunit epsilon
MKENKTMHVSVVGPEAEIFSGNANMVFVKGALGDLGIAPGHLQLLTTIKPGPLRIEHDKNMELLYISGGILEIQPERITILADSLERPQDVNEAAALEAKQAAETLLKEQNNEIDKAKIQQQLLEALAKLQVLELMRTHKKF